MELQGKTCLITGATSGIGKQTAIALAKMGVKLVITCRDTEKGFMTKNEIFKLTCNPDVEVMKCDLASFESIRSFSEKFKSKYDKLHILINNAGTWQTTRQLSEDGIELTLATNVLAPFLLTNLLLDLMKQSSPARIINVASHAHKFAKLDFENLEGLPKFNNMQVYGQSKIELILITNKLAEMLKGSGVTANSLHPGVVATHLFDNMGGFVKSIVRTFMISPEKGAKTSVYLSSSTDVAGITGQYFAKSKIYKPTSEATNKENSDRIWQICNNYVKNYL